MTIQYNVFELYLGHSLWDKSNKYREQITKEISQLEDEIERTNFGADLSRIIRGAKIWAIIRPMALAGTIYLGWIGEPAVLVPAALGACSAAAEEKLPHRAKYISSKIKELQESDKQNNKPYIVQVALNQDAFGQGIKEII